MLGITAIVKYSNLASPVVPLLGLFPPIYTNAFSIDCPYRKENKPNMAKQITPPDRKETPILYQCAGRLSPMPFRPYFVRRMNGIIHILKNTNMTVP